MKSLQLLLAFLFTGISFFQVHGQGGVQPIQPNSPTTASWKTHSGDFYQIQYPADWDVDTSGQSGTTFFLTSLLTGDGDTFRENVNLLLQDLSAYNMDLDEYIKISEEQIGQLFPDGQIISSDRFNTHQPEFHRLVYVGKQGTRSMQFLAYCWLIDKTAYILTFTCEEDQWADYGPTGERILKSFQLNLGK
ncbi:MAG: hypothetical protein AAFV80_06545 [Bacteroidota bacterium]